jgi:hypothetical protein
MNQTEKREFIEQLIECVRKSVLSKIPEMPEEWDGYELRWYLQNKFQEIAYRPSTVQRRREYKNTVLVKNL